MSAHPRDARGRYSAVLPPHVHIEVTGRVMTEIDLDHYERYWDDLNDREPKQADWFCLRIEPWRCSSCGRTLTYMTHGGERGEHLVIVWPSKDDPNMYETIGVLEGRAAIVPYEEAIGPSVSFYEIHPR